MRVPRNPVRSGYYGGKLAVSLRFTSTGKGTMTTRLAGTTKTRGKGEGSVSQRPNGTWRADLATVPIPCGWHSVVVAEQFVGAVDEMDVQCRGSGIRI